MSATRRTILQGLAALPVAAVPAVIPDRVATAAGHPDAALLARAAVVEAAARRSNATMARACEIGNKLERLTPPHPLAPPRPVGFDTTVEHGPDGSMTIRNVPRPVDPATELAQAEHAEAVEAWRAQRDAISRSIGHRAAERLHARAYRRLEMATRDLTPMAPTTLAGAVAMARVAVELDPNDDDCLTEWETAFRAAVLRNVASIGAAA